MGLCRQRPCLRMPPCGIPSLKHLTDKKSGSLNRVDLVYEHLQKKGFLIMSNCRNAAQRCAT